MTSLIPPGTDVGRARPELPPLPERAPLTPPTLPPPVRARADGSVAARRAGSVAGVPASLATAAGALLDRLADHARQAEELDGLGERVARLTRRSGARQNAGPTDDAGPAADLAVVRAELDRCEDMLRELSAAVSLRQVPRGRPSRRHTAEVERLRARLDEAHVDAGRIATRARRALASAQSELERRAATDAAGAAELEAVAPVVLGGWDVNRWASWEPNGAAADELRIGRWREPATGAALALPCVVSLASRGASGIEIVSHDEPQRVAATGLLQALVLRIVAGSHGRVRLTLLDPLGGGAACAGASALGAAVPSPATIESTVRIALADALRGARERHESSTGPDDRTHVMVVADFPAAYDATTVEALKELARAGASGGVHMMLHRHVDGSGEPVAAVGESIVVLDLANVVASCGSRRGDVVIDDAPPRVLFDVVAHRLRSTPLRDAPLAWDREHGDRSTWWTASADDGVVVALGRLDEQGPLDLWFGCRADRFWPSEHAAVAAKPGAGRSTFLRNLVLSLAVTYRPDDVHVSYIDARHGTDAEVFAALPHARLISARTTPAQLRSFVEELVADVRERHELFARLGVRDLSGYRRRQFAFRRRGHDGPLARHVVVIDDYEQMFAGDDDGGAARHLLELLETGGAAGVHLVLAGRNFRAEGIVRRNEVLSHVQQRWALAMAADDIAATHELGADGRLLAASFLDRPGRVVVNDHAGAPETSRAARLASLDSTDAEAIVRELAARAAREFGERAALPATVVLNGLAPPELLDNPHLGALLRNDCWDAPDFVEALARAPLTAGGFGLDEWLQADRPFPLLVGVEDGGRRPAVVQLRRRPGAHVVAVGRDHGARGAMLAASIVSVALVESPGAWQAWIADRGAGSDAGGGLTLEGAAEQLRRVGVDVRYGRTEDHALDLVRAAAAEVDDRRTVPADALATRPTVVLVLAEPDRVRGLARDASGDGLVDSPAGAALRRVLVHGPTVGVHVLIGTTSPAMLRTVVSDAVVQRDVHHRIVMPVHEDDSFALVRSAAAARPRDAAPVPPSAVLYDGERHDLVRFRPYVDDYDEPLAPPPRHGSFAQQVEQVCAALAARRQ